MCEGLSTLANTAEEAAAADAVGGTGGVKIQGTSLPCNRRNPWDGDNEHECEPHYGNNHITTSTLLVEFRGWVPEVFPDTR